MCWSKKSPFGVLIFCMICWLALPSFPLRAAETAQPLTLAQIYAKLDAIHTLSYLSKTTLPTGMTWDFNVWIKGDIVKAEGPPLKAGQVGGRSYQRRGDQWFTAPGLSVNTLITFLKEAREAGDTTLLGVQTIADQETTVIEYTRPRSNTFVSANEIKVTLWLSHKLLLPIKIQALNVTENKSQTEEISRISLDAFDDAVFEDMLARDREVKQKEGEKWKPWMAEKETLYRNALNVDEDRRLSAEQKKDYWESTLSAICQDNPFSDKDDEMRNHARSRLQYWKDQMPPSAAAPSPAKSSAAAADPARDGTFIARENGVVEDTATGLEWTPWLDADTSWFDANAWVKQMPPESGWRLPTRDELKTLYRKDISRNNLTPLLGLSGSSVWSGEKKNASSAWTIIFLGGATSYRLLAVDCNRCMGERTLAVRPKATQ